MTYKQTHDELGNPRSADFSISDLVICSIAFAVIAALFSGALA